MPVMKKNPLELRLEKYAKSKAEYRHPCSHTVLLLSAGAAAGIGAFICPPPAEAAVQYSGLKNISMGTEEDPIKRSIDLDGDGINDFTFDFWRYKATYSISSLRMKRETSVFWFDSPSTMNQVIFDQVGVGGKFPSPALLPGNYTIESNLPDSKRNQWHAGKGMLAGHATMYYRVFYSPGMTYERSESIGNFIGKKGYLGVRFQISGQTHYGWIQFRTDENMRNGSIIDWAYEDQADMPIRAGEGRFNWSLFMPAIANGANRTP